MHQYMTGDLTNSEPWPKHKKPTKPQLQKVHYSIGLPGAFESLSTAHFHLLLIKKKKKNYLAVQEQNQPLSPLFCLVHLSAFESQPNYKEQASASFGAVLSLVTL